MKNSNFLGCTVVVVAVMVGGLTNGNISGGAAESPCPGDIDGNRVVNVFDLLELLAVWGPCTGCAADLTGDDVVNVFDLLALLAAWGPCHTTESCDDGVLNGDETDIDCGGSCPPCAVGQNCIDNSDCASGICGSGNVCEEFDLCSDGLLNGDETDIDCGGSCPPCAEGQSCILNSDCITGLCGPSNTCE